MPVIAVHTIVKNEAEHLKRWAESASDADVLMVADTGSDDDTVEVAEELGIDVEEIGVDPWRFDLARNAGVALLGDDVDFVITVDADEILVEGWRARLEEAITENPEAKRFSYQYVWSWVDQEDGSKVPDVQFVADRCYSRAGWMWHGAVHEVLVPSGPGTLGAQAAYAGFTIEHYADAAKPRSSYLPLLELAVGEEPRNPRQRFYLAREYFFTGQWDVARQTFVEYLSMPEARWPAERAEAFRYIAKMDDSPETWLLRAVAEDPARRDAVVDLVDLYQKQDRLQEAAGWAVRAMRVAERPGDYMTSARVWDDDRLREVIDRSGVFD
jgi:glycosyltransferase involved in cell wall biosynthesis